MVYLWLVLRFYVVGCVGLLIGLSPLRVGVYCGVLFECVCWVCAWLLIVVGVDEVGVVLGVVVVCCRVFLCGVVCVCVVVCVFVCVELCAVIVLFCC